MCQTSQPTVLITPKASPVVECKACAMIAAKMRGRRPKHVQECGYVQPEKILTKKERKAQLNYPKLPQEMQKQIIEGVKAWKQAKKEHAKIKSQYHKELKKVVTKVKPVKAPVRKSEKQNKQNKTTKTTKPKVQMVDAECQTDFKFVHKCMRFSCKEVQLSL